MIYVFYIALITAPVLVLVAMFDILVDLITSWKEKKTTK
jgi:hypothetical protein